MLRWARSDQIKRILFGAFEVEAKAIQMTLSRQGPGCTRSMRKRLCKLWRTNAILLSCLRQLGEFPRNVYLFSLFSSLFSSKTGT